MRYCPPSIFQYEHASSSKTTDSAVTHSDFVFRPGASKRFGGEDSDVASLRPIQPVPQPTDFALSGKTGQCVEGPRVVQSPRERVQFLHPQSETHPFRLHINEHTFPIAFLLLSIEAELCIRRLSGIWHHQGQTFTTPRRQAPLGGALGDVLRLSTCLYRANATDGRLVLP